ncbi:nucleolar protein 11 [Leptopilina boulardi]|uniref:nucleolar protein 11 n=1 Tax=Leptopilina boulardi TaxID=63433 RepID=UPI0021F5BE07|nr:nucleolar protein 11 [Leptopilina boulardi]
MAKLCSYYTLSPLIDQQNLLGVEKDSNPGCAIITLGRNIVIRYKLQDVKQVSSWSTKERLTSQVIYDETTKSYSAVFNEKYIRVWLEEETELDKVKKNKFTLPLHSILTLEGFPPVVLLQNGNTASLKWALKNRKNWSCKEILKSKETLLKSQLVNVNYKSYLCTLTKLDNVYNYILMPLENDIFLGEAEKIIRIELKRDLETLVGHVVMQDKKNAYLLTLWSDGRLYSYSLINSSLISSPGELLSKITIVNTKYPVVMIPLNETTIAMYGADSLEEGAVLCVYNVQFKLVQAVQKLKLYTNDAKLWKVEDKLLLAANRHLSVAPFRLAPQRLEPMVGSSLNHKNNDFDETSDVAVIKNSEGVISKWEEQTSSPVKLKMNKSTNSIFKQISALTNEGFRNSAIPEVIIPELIESKDITSILWCLDNFRDLPEKLLVDLLSFSLRTSDNVKSLRNGDIDKEPTKIVSNIQDKFLNKIFSSTYTDIYLLMHLKTSLSFEEILKVLKNLVERLDIEENLDQQSEEPDFLQLYQWTNLLLDSHYQNYLLARDPQILNKLQNLQIILDKHFQLLKDLENLRPMLVRILSGKPVKPTTQDFNKFYSIEEVKLY